MDCIFCKIINGEIPSYKIYEDDDLFTMLDINPVSHGHILILPKKHFDTTEVTDDEIISKMIVVAKNMGREIKKIFNSSGFNIMVNNGKSAGQVIFHTHFHVIQRFENDNLGLWPIDEDEKIKVEKTYHKIIENLK